VWVVVTSLAVVRGAGIAVTKDLGEIVLKVI
jgi:hypothetical protein